MEGRSPGQKAQNKSFLKSVNMKPFNIKAFTKLTDAKTEDIFSVNVLYYSEFFKFTKLFQLFFSLYF